ncbi:AfsR/SARP family transcriptional regulator [Cellulomonas sp. Marseille-Q8402]
MTVTVGVLGPVAAWSPDGEPLALRGPRHRAVLARLVAARGRTVGVRVLADDLWEVPPGDAVGALRTFVAALRRALEPDRPPRAPARVLVTDGTGYALRLPPGAVDAERFTEAVEAARTLPPSAVPDALGAALSWWRGDAYADLGDAPWAGPERARLTELRLQAAELRAGALVATGRAPEAVPDLEVHVAAHPWREEGWRLLALALYRADRQGDALAVLRAAQERLVEDLGVDPGRGLRDLEQQVLRQEDPAPGGTTGPSAAGPWADAAAAYERAAPGATRARLQSAVDVLRRLAVTGGAGLAAARDQRLATIRAVEQQGDPLLAARVIGAYDVPGVWARSDDPAQAGAVVAAAERALTALGPDGPPPLRARLLATVAVEHRGTADPRAQHAAAEAERIARSLGDPALLVFALNGTLMQTFHRAGLAAARDAVGAELVAVAHRHGLVTAEILGHLARVQARAGIGDLLAADRHAAAADALGARDESPLVGAFTGWYAALRLALQGGAAPHVAAAYRAADARLEGAGMPGVRDGLLPLALLALDVRDGRPARHAPEAGWGPYDPWTRPHVLLARGDRTGAARALRDLPDPAHDHLQEALWALAAQAAVVLGDRDVAARALAALAPAAGEDAGAASGMLTVGPVHRHVATLTAFLAT